MVKFMQTVRLILSLIIAIAFGVFLYYYYPGSRVVWKQYVLVLGYTLLAFGLCMDLAGFFRNWGKKD
jgi:hypothetical protein